MSKNIREELAGNQKEMYHGKRFDIPMDIFESLKEFNRKVKEELSAKAKDGDAA